MLSASLRYIGMIDINVDIQSDRQTENLVRSIIHCLQLQCHNLTSTHRIVI